MDAKKCVIIKFYLGTPTKDLFTSMHQPLGLLEVLPLSFKCISSSNGTSVEKNPAAQDSSQSSNSNSYYILPDFFSLFSSNGEQSTSASSSGLQPPQQTNGEPVNVDTSIFNSIFHLNQLQYLIVERMEPVSRHFVLIDFGFPVVLTDVMIPACGELSSLSIDVWLQKEQKDSKRLCVSTDINQNAILLNDLQPAPVCRFLKLIFVAHSTNIVKAKIPIGYFFGYPQVLFNQNTETTPTNPTTASTAPADLTWVLFVQLFNSTIIKNHNFFISISKRIIN